jgi:hypothetical protein
LSFTQAFEVRNRVHARATTESWILRSERDWLEPVLSRGGARNDESSEDAGGPEILGTANTDDYINRTPSRGYSSTALSLRNSSDLPSSHICPHISQWCAIRLLIPHGLHLTPHPGPPHNNTSRLLRRPHNRSRSLRIVPSSRGLAEICRREPNRWRRRRQCLLCLEHHHGRGVPDFECRAGQDGQH